ncbi:MAG: hypothetical protein JRI23_34465 [Deltaproteobacteria bacterium]|jgi:hypothetical protein|nr:hypothetical protein [Deltaproteobacteria bacterium]MBW2537403.1 hypothetical protein [Deltaproteobacteria bacterium]
MNPLLPPTLDADMDANPVESAEGDAATAESLEEIQLFRHSKRPEWGLAIVVRERDGRYDVQFQDGAMRAMAKEFLELLVPVDRPADETSSALRDLTAMSGMALARSARDSEAGTRAISLDEQIGYFLEQYEDGFDDDQWTKRVRGIGQRRRAKGHRDPVIQMARELLSAQAIDELLEQLRPDEVLDRALRIMKSTSLISKAQLRPFEELGMQRHTLFARALRDLLYGDTDFELAFVKFQQVFRHTPSDLSWAATTLWLALVEPDEHLCVRPAVLADQARWMAPVLRMPSGPDGRIYLRLRDMVLAVRDELRKRGLPPRDVMDVYDFMWCTLRPAAQKAILARPPAPQASRVKLKDDADDAEGAAA